MKIIILKEKLKKGLNIIEKAISKSLTLPILNNVLISAEKNFLILSTTDLEIGIKCWILSKIDKEGKITVPAKFLSNYISLIVDEKIILETKNETLFINHKKGKAQIKGLTADEFPIIPELKENLFLEIDSLFFCQGISQVMEIAVFAQNRPEISGIYFSFEKDLIKITATDSSRLAEKKLFCKNKINKECSLILPQKTAREVVNIFSENKEKLRIKISSNQILFESFIQEHNHPQVQVVSRLIEGKYPNYQEIIPSSFMTHIVLNRNEFLNQIKTAILFGGKSNEVKIKVDPKKEEIEIFAQNPDLGENVSIIPCKIKGEEVETVFNHRFLFDGLSNIKSSEVIFELNGDAGPALLRPVGDESYLYVVMPIKNH